MPTDEDRLRNALRAAAREPSADGVLSRVHAKQARRRTVQRAQRGALALLLLVGIVTIGLVALDANGDHHQQVAVNPAPGSFPQVRVIDGSKSRDVRVQRVRVKPDEGYLRGPIIASGGGLALAGYDRAGSSYTFPPSRVVRIDTEGTVTEVDGLQGEILAMTEGEGARWVLTRDKNVTGPQDPEYRVKRIGPSGDVVSNPVPLGELPLRTITAGGGGVWVGVGEGVLRFDPVTGEFADKITLAHPSQQRAVGVGGKFVFAADENTLVRLDPASSLPGEVVGQVPVGIDVADATPTAGFAYMLGFDSSTNLWVVSDGEQVLPFHESFHAVSIHNVGDVVWVDGQLDGVRTLAIIDTSSAELSIARTIRITNEADAAVVLTSERSLVIASRGSLFEARLPA